MVVARASDFVLRYEESMPGFLYGSFRINFDLIDADAAAACSVGFIPRQRACSTRYVREFIVKFKVRNLRMGVVNFTAAMFMLCSDVLSLQNIQGLSCFCRLAIRHIYRHENLFIILVKK